MAQTKRLLLPHIADPRQRRDAARDSQQLVLAALFERRVQLEAVVEVVFHRALAAAGDDDDVLNSGGDRLFHAVLNDGLVDQRQHLLGDDLGGRQKTRAEPARGKYCFAYSLLISSPSFDASTIRSC